MCVVERRTYIHSDDRRDIVEKIRRCHHATGKNLCQYVDYKDVNVARVVEARPSSSRSTPPHEIITMGRDGRTERHRTLVRRMSKRSPPRESDQSPVDSVAGPSSPLKATYREVRPPAPSPPPVFRSYPSARRPGLVSAAIPPYSSRTIEPDSAAVYSRPPSLEAERAALIERRPRRSSVSSTTATVDDDLEPPLIRQPSYRSRRPSNIAVDVRRPNSSPLASPAGSPSSPGLSSLPRVRSVRRDSGKSRLRADTLLDTRQPDEDYEESRRSQERTEEAALLHQDRQSKRVSFSQDLSPPRRRDSKRDSDLQKRYAAEWTQMARERSDAEVRRSFPPSLPPPPPALPSSSARPLISARYQTPAVVHNPNQEDTRRYSSSTWAPPDLLEYGEAVIRGKREEAQGRAEALQRLTLADDVDEAPQPDGLQRHASRRLRREKRANEEGYYE